MKNIKKLLSIVMVLAMVLALGVSAFASAAPEQSTLVKLPDVYDGHKMVAYKIFNGSQNADSEDGQLGVTEWADGVNVSGLLTALAGKYNSKLTGDNEKYQFEDGMGAVDAAESISVLAKTTGFDAAQFAKDIKEFIGGTGVPFTEEKPIQATLPGGYWIIVDESYPDGGEPKDFSYSAYLLEVVGYENEVTLDPKVGTPQVDKTVGDQNDSDLSEIIDVNTGKAAAYDIGDDVPFMLKASMPGTLVGYTSYKVVFHDTLSAGLKLDEDNLKSFKLWVNDGEPIAQEGNWKLETQENEDGTTTITITIENVMAAPFNAGVNDTITVTYDATLDDDAVIGSLGNENTVYLEYSNNPNDNGTGDTPDSKVTVFSFKLDVHKVDGAKKEALEGAGFTLYKWYANDSEAGGEWKAVGDELKGDEMTDFTFKGLDAGKYKIEETTVPAGYNKCDDIEFTVKATIDQETKKVTALSVADVKGATEKDFTITIEAGDIETTVINDSGLELPETGGIGTTIFYIVGAILVAGAVILLVTKRRVNGAEK